MAATLPPPFGTPLPPHPPLASSPHRVDGLRVDVAVVGAGVIGLSIGWRLAARGLRVAVVDRGQPGSGASLAATGMLAAAAEFEPGGEELAMLALESQFLWPDFAAELEAAAGASIDYRRHETLLVALGRDEVARARFRHELAQRAGFDCRWLEGPALRDREPGLTPSVVGGMSCPRDHQVDPQRVVGALRRALVAAGGLLVGDCEVKGVDVAAGRVDGLRTSLGVVRAEAVVVAAGVWSASGGLLPPSMRLPIRPLKGQSLALRMDDPPPLDRVVWSEQVHLAPKSDGRLIVGATVEERGFDKTVTAGGVYALLEGARRVLPCIEEMELAAVWTGWRPTTDDDAPVIGATSVDGLFLAAGHHRNGYLLAPVTAQAVEALVLGALPPASIAGFGADRFTPTPMRTEQGEHA